MLPYTLPSKFNFLADNSSLIIKKKGRWVKLNVKIQEDDDHEYNNVFL